MRVWILLALAWSACLAGVASAAAEPKLLGHWEGTIEVPGIDSGLGMKVDLARKPGVWSGTIDIRMQEAKGLALKGVQIAGDSLRFAIAGIPGAPTFRGRLEGEEIHGTFTQGGRSFPFRLGRGALAEPKRPQEPQDPVPYGREEVAFPSGDHLLAGTLTLPEGPGPFPGVVLVSGSGPQDRGEIVFHHRPFLVLADRLTR